MKRIRQVYLAGPGFDLPYSQEVAEDARLMCEASGFTCTEPQANALTERDHSEAMAREIYAERIYRLRQSDAGVINLTPTRGPHCDPAAAFEAGFLAALGKPVMAYMNVIAEDDAELLARVEAYVGASQDEDGLCRDGDGRLVEDFGLPESLMLWAEARRLYVVVTAESQTDLTGLQLCLDALKLYSD